jgi:hypothetical protein
MANLDNDAVERLIERLRAAKPNCNHHANAGLCHEAAEALARQAGGQVSDDTVGWAHLNPDTGIEWSRNHPVESGECEDAEDIERMTLGQFRQRFQVSDDAIVRVLDVMPIFKAFVLGVQTKAGSGWNDGDVAYAVSAFRSALELHTLAPPTPNKAGQPSDKCPTCDAESPGDDEFCSDGFHAPGATYWPGQPSDDAGKLTPQFVAMSPLQKWETLALNGLLGTDEPWIEDMRQALKRQETALTSSPINEGVIEAGDELADKLWILRCDSRDALAREAAEKAIEAWNAAKLKERGQC